MRSVLALLLLVLLGATATTSIAQEMMTVGQLLDAGDREPTALGAAMYIMGWKEGTSFELSMESVDRQITAAPRAGSAAARRVELGNCLAGLEVADLAGGLHASLRDGTITPETTASSGLRTAMQSLCPAIPGVDE